jgi:hypothetical protein
LPPLCAGCLKILGASTSWNPQGLSRPLMGLLCYLTYLRCALVCLFLTFSNLNGTNPECTVLCAAEKGFHETTNSFFKSAVFVAEFDSLLQDFPKSFYWDFYEKLATQLTYV